MWSKSVASAQVILMQIRQRLRVAVSQEEKWYPTILRAICSNTSSIILKMVTIQCKTFFFQMVENNRQEENGHVKKTKHFIFYFC